MKRSRINPVSKKQAIRNALYKDMRIEYLRDNPVCEGLDCCEPATDIHHKCGRNGDRLTDTDNFMAVCRRCHQFIHNNPTWSKEKGYLLCRG